MTSTSLPGALTHPDLEELAAFLDGTLPEEDRARVMEHLADCQECYAIFAGAARFQEDSLKEEPEEEKDSVVPFPQKRRSPVRRWLPLAAAALLAVAVGVPLYRAYLAPPDMAVGELAAANKKNAGADSDNLWLGTQYRGGTGQNSALLRDSVQLGVQVTNLHLSLRAGNRETASDIILPQIRNLLENGEFFGTDNSIQGYSQLREGIGAGRPLHELLEQAAELGADLHDRVETSYFDLGKWTAAARLAAVTKNPDFFDRRANRRFPSWFLKEEGDSIAEREVSDALREIQTILGQDEIDYDTLRTNLETILTTYDD